MTSGRACTIQTAGRLGGRRRTRLRTAMAFCTTVVHRATLARTAHILTVLVRPLLAELCDGS